MLKNKKRIIILIVSVLSLVLLLFLASFLYERYEKEKFAKEISSHYGKNVKVIKDTFLYNDKNEEIGILYKDLNIELDKQEDKYNTYFKLVNSDYYILYSDVEKIDEDRTYDVYQTLTRYPHKNYIVKTTTKTKFYQEDKELFSINKSLELDVVMEEDNYYYVVFDNNIYQVKKDEVTTEEKETKNKYLEKISIFYFNDFDKLDEKLSYIKEKEYKSISPTDLKLFLNGNVELEKNSVLLFYNKDLSLEKIDKQGFEFYLESDSELEFKSGDSQITRETKNYTWYKVDKNTKLSRFKDMLVGKKEVKVTSTSSNPNSSVAVLNYHFFYSSQAGEACNESICLDTKNFEEQLKYLKDNNIDTLTMQEYVDWIYGRKELTRKSVLLTIDDGAMGTNTHLPDLLEKYDMNATLFLISGWWPMSKYRTGNLEIQSHTHDLHHNSFKRDGKTGIKTVMLSYDELMSDLSLSVNTVGTNLAFCYPFYAYNNTLVQAVKDTGFQVAFVGGNKKSTRNNDKYKIPRYIIYKNTSLSSFKNMVN